MSASLNTCSKLHTAAVTRMAMKHGVFTQNREHETHVLQAGSVNQSGRVKTPTVTVLSVVVALLRQQTADTPHTKK